MYLHECLLRMGYSVACHPELEGTSRRPDFLAEKDGRSVYVEARSTSISDVAVRKSARVNAVYESLDRLDSPNYFHWIEVAKQGDEPLRARPLRRRLEKWLAGLDPDEHQLLSEQAAKTVDVLDRPHPLTVGRPTQQLIDLPRPRVHTQL